MIDGYRIEHQQKKIIKEKFLITRTYHITKDNKLVQKVKHYHFKGWPDFEIPVKNSEETLKNLLNCASDFLTK